MNFKAIFKKIIGKSGINTLHGIKAFIASGRFGNPSSKLRVIGITGTKGKTSTSMILGRLFNLSGVKTGYITTGSMYLGNKSDKTNDILKLSKIRQKIIDQLNQK